MTPIEFEHFLIRHDLKDAEFADLVGVTIMAVNNWRRGKRTMSLTLVRLLRFFDRKPEMMKEFVA